MDHLQDIIKNKKYVIGSVIAAFVLLNILLVPYLNKRSAIKSVKKVLTFWVEDNLIEPVEFWEDPEKSPPVYGLQSFKILNKRFYKKDGGYFAEIVVVLNLSQNTIMPSGKSWVFKLKNTSKRWKIVDFYIYEDPR